MHKSVFFNLFFEVEPFAAIMIAHKTYGRSQEFVMRPEGPKFDAGGQGQERGSCGGAARVSGGVL